MSKREPKKRASIFVKGVVAAFIVFCAITIFTQILSYAESEQQILELEDNIYALNEDIAALNEDLAQEIDDEYIERVARSMLNYHLPEEILFFNDLVD